MLQEQEQRPSDALLLIDFQKDFLEATGRMPIDQSQLASLLQAARTAVGQARSASWPIVAIGNEFKRMDPLNLFRKFASLEGSAGAEWDSRAPMDRDVYFAKHAGSSFSNPELEPWLRERGVQRIWLAGVYAYGCVAATAKDALRRGFEVTLICDAIGCRSDASRRRNLEKLVRAGAVLAPALA